MRQAGVEQRTDRRHTAIVLVAAVDRRIVPALRFVSRLPQTDVRALHVSVDPDETRRLAEDWMRLGLTWLPLSIHDPPAEELLSSVGEAVRREAEQRGEVTVVVPELELPCWWHPLLHRRSARRIARHLQSLTGVTTVIVPFAVPPGRRGEAAPA